MASTMIRIRNGYRDQLPEDLTALAEDPRYQDTVLVCQDGIVRASRFVLVLAVPMLKRPLRGRDEEEVVILMPNFATYEVKQAMGMVFMASGMTYEKKDVKNNLEEQKSLFSESKTESKIFNMKDEEMLPIKNEVDSDHDPDVECVDSDNEPGKLNQDYNWEGWEIPDKELKSIKQQQNHWYADTNHQDDYQDDDEDYEEEEEEDDDDWKAEKAKPKATKSPKKKNNYIENYWEESDTWEEGSSKPKKRRKKNAPEIENFDCCICDETFNSREEYKKHESEKHVRDGMIFCPFPNCDKKYKATETRYGQSKLIVRHILRHKGKQEEESFVCPECGKTFKNRGSLKPHMALHKGVKNIHCDECDQSFYTTSALLSHKMRQHDDQAEVICPECGKTCSNKYTLKRHMIRHTGERQFKCEWEGCGKSFYDSQVLKVHEKLHLDLKEFQCSLCPKQFRQSQHLVVHMKRHQGVRKIFVC